MKKYIYYPSFEPPNEVWLKFALLYFDNLYSIIPYDRQKLVSSNYNLIQKETDLLYIHSPEHSEGYRASIKTIEELEKFLGKDNYSLSGLFNNVSSKTQWSNPENWNYKIYKEKYSNDLLNFVKDEKIGFSNDEGLYVSEELAFIFMTYLASEISHKITGHIITDNQKYDDYLNFKKANDNQLNQLETFAKQVIQMKLPKNISNITFAKLIDFRNKNRELIKNFNKELKNIEDTISDGLSPEKFIDSFNSIYDSLNFEIAMLGSGIITIYFAFYVLNNNPNSINPEYYKEIFGSIATLGGGSKIYQTYQSLGNKRLMRRYFTQLNNLR